MNDVDQNDLMIKKMHGIKERKSTSMNNQHTDDNRYTTPNKNIHIHTSARNNVKHIGKRINLFKSIFDEQLMGLIHHTLVSKSTFVEMLIMMLKLIHQSKLNIFFPVVQ